MENIDIPQCGFELSKSIFLRDLMEPYYEFEVKRNRRGAPKVHIYENKGPGIKEEVSTGQLIYFMHCEMPDLIQNRCWQLARERDDYFSKYKDHQLYEDQRQMGSGRWYNSGTEPVKRKPTEIQKTFNKNEQNAKKIYLIKECYHNYFKEISGIRNAVNNISILMEKTKLTGEEPE